MLWAIPGGKLSQSLGTPRGSVWAVMVAVGGKLLVSGDGRGEVRVWDARTGKERGTLEGHAGHIHDIASTGGRLLAVASQDGTVRLWDAEAGKELRVLKLGRPAWSVAFSPDGRLLAAGDNRGTLKVWKVAAAKQGKPWARHFGKTVPSPGPPQQGDRRLTACPRRTMIGGQTGTVVPENRKKLSSSPSRRS